MKKLWPLAVLAFPVLLLGGCGWGKREALGPPNSRLLHHHGDSRVWTFCDQGNRIYQNAQGDFQVVAGGCPAGYP